MGEGLQFHCKGVSPWPTKRTRALRFVVGPCATDVPGDQWAEFLDRFSREHLDDPVAVEVQGETEAAAGNLARNVPLVGVSASMKEGQNEIEVILGDSPEGPQMSHVVPRPTRVYSSARRHGEELLELVSEDGTTTVVHEALGRACRRRRLRAYQADYIKPGGDFLAGPGRRRAGSIEAVARPWLSPRIALGIAEEIGQRGFGFDHGVAPVGVRVRDHGAPLLQVADEVAEVFLGRDDVELHDRLEQHRAGLSQRLVEGVGGGHAEGDSLESVSSTSPPRTVILSFISG